MKFDCIGQPTHVNDGNVLESRKGEVLEDLTPQSSCSATLLLVFLQGHFLKHYYETNMTLEKWSAYA